MSDSALLLVGWLLELIRSKSWQHLRSYHGGYWLARGHTHGGFIVLPHWKLVGSSEINELANKVASTMTWYPTQSHYPDTELTSPYHISLILVMPSTRLGTNKQILSVFKSVIWLDQGIELATFRMGSLLSIDEATASSQQLLQLYKEAHSEFIVEQMWITYK